MIDKNLCDNRLAIIYLWLPFQKLEVSPLFLCSWSRIGALNPHVPESIPRRFVRTTRDPMHSSLSKEEAIAHSIVSKEKLEWMLWRGGDYTWNIIKATETDCTVFGRLLFKLIKLWSCNCKVTIATKRSLEGNGRNKQVTIFTVCIFLPPSSIDLYSCS